MDSATDPGSVERRSIHALSVSRFWTAMLPAMLLPLLGSLFYFVLMGESDAAKGIYLGVKIFTVLWPILCCIAVWKIGLPKIGWKPEHPAAVIAAGLASGAAICGIMFLAMQTQLAEGVWAGRANILAKVEGLGILNYYWLFACVISIVHSFVEEYYWRWFVFGKLHERIRAGWAYPLGALAFMAHHVVILSQYFSWPLVVLFSLSVAVGGLLWSWMLIRQRTLWGAWISHALVDFGIFAIGHQLMFSQP